MKGEIPKQISDGHPEFLQWAILAGYRGSIAHGMYVPKSNPDSIDDKDTMSVCIPPLDHYFGLSVFGSKGTKEIKVAEWDIVCYEFRKFISLLCKGNPNVISLLWLKPQYYLKKTNAGKSLIQHRDLFSSKQIFHSFSGYAHGQLHRMTHCACEGYMGQKRKQLVERFGYDTKNAAHLIRLLRMAIEFLNESVFYVQRESDATQLLDIKMGKWTLEQVKAEADRLFQRAEAAYDKSTLPAQPDMAKINELTVSIVSRHFADNLVW